ncbi:unnamed protein product [Candida verbasci]|uniref:Cysteine proteinase 1, mitochondrial n=1 Tax=Candida verbasci TaxID=1227364 RepID=A0A9W4X8V1_9ASCO|nr:unnamed protein product [Candida verbasci]
MGLYSSKETKVKKQLPMKSVDQEITNEKAYGSISDFSNYFQNLDIDKLNISDLNPISNNTLSTWESDFHSKTKNKLTQNVLANNPIEKVINQTSSSLSNKDKYLFNVTVDTIGSPSHLNNQKSSGRCWIFATCNVIRSHIIKQYNLKDDEFQLSQSYLYFYDKLEKANYFLENIDDTYKEELDSRLIQYLFKDPVGDGGQHDMIVNLVEKYGLTPNEIFIDNSQSTSSSKINYIITEKLREFGLKIRDLRSKKAPEHVVKNFKTSAMKTIYNTISLAIGTPPKPSDEFTWEYIDKDGKYKSYKTTPKEFYEKFVKSKYDVSEHFSLIHDPRNEYNKLYTVDRLNNIFGGKPIEYVNIDIDDIKSVAIKMLKDNQPIFFGSDVGKFGDRTTGILDTTAYDYNTVFDYDLGLNKAERLKTGSSLMTHAMVITGVHLDENEKPIRWKIENSWGDAVGKKGYFLMTDEWFNEYVFQIVTSQKYSGKKYYDIWKSKEYNVLPYYDPMGSLA